MDPSGYDFGEQKSIFSKLGGYLVEIIETVVVCVAIFFIIYLFVAQFHKVSGSSMVPTLKNGDYLITEKVSYRFGSPKRGDIIVLKNPKDESQDFIKRIMVLPGETVKIENNVVYINGKSLPEKYIATSVHTQGGSFLTEGSTLKAGPNQYFVFGDNREHSSDSREWGGVTKEEIVGRAFFRYWPPKSMGLLTDK